MVPATPRPVTADATMHGLGLTVKLLLIHVMVKFAIITGAVFRAFANAHPTFMAIAAGSRSNRTITGRSRQGLRFEGVPNSVNLV